MSWLLLKISVSRSRGLQPSAVAWSSFGGSLGAGTRNFNLSFSVRRNPPCGIHFGATARSGAALAASIAAGARMASIVSGPISYMCYFDIMFDIPNT